MESLPTAFVLVLAACSVCVAFVAASRPNLFSHLHGPPEALTAAWLCASAAIGIGLDWAPAVFFVATTGTVWRFLPKASRPLLELPFVLVGLALNVSEVLLTQDSSNPVGPAWVTVTMAVVLGAAFSLFGLSAAVSRPMASTTIAASILASTELILRVLRPTPGIELVFHAGLQDAPEGLAALLFALALVVVAGAAPRQMLGLMGVGVACLDLVLSTFGHGAAAQVLMLSSVGFVATRWRPANKRFAGRRQSTTRKAVTQ